MKLLDDVRAGDKAAKDLLESMNSSSGETVSRILDKEAEAHEEVMRMLSSMETNQKTINRIFGGFDNYPQNSGSSDEDPESK